MNKVIQADLIAEMTSSYISAKTRSVCLPRTRPHSPRNGFSGKPFSGFLKEDVGKRGTYRAQLKTTNLMEFLGKKLRRSGTLSFGLHDAVFEMDTLIYLLCKGLYLL